MPQAMRARTSWSPLKRIARKQRRGDPDTTNTTMLLRELGDGTPDA